MKCKIGECGEHVFQYDESGEKLLRKFWFYPSGLVTCRLWDAKTGDQITKGERVLLNPVEGQYVRGSVQTARDET